MFAEYPLTQDDARQYYRYIGQIVTDVDTLPARGNLLRTIWDIVLRDVYMVIAPSTHDAHIPPNFFKVRYEAVKSAYDFPELKATLNEKIKNQNKEVTILEVFNNLQHCNDGQILKFSPSRYRFALRYLLNMISLLSGLAIPPYLLQSCKEIKLPEKLKKPLSVTFIVQTSGDSLQDNIISAKVMKELQDSLSTLYEGGNVRKYLKNVSFNLHVYGIPLALIDNIQIHNSAINSSWTISHSDNLSANEVLKNIINKTKLHVPLVEQQPKVPLYKQRLQRDKKAAEHKPLIFWLAHNVPINLESAILDDIDYLTSNHLIRFYPLGLSNNAMSGFRKLFPSIKPLRLEVTANLFSVIFDTISSL